jgi:hypothetical protein
VLPVRTATSRQATARQPVGAAALPAQAVTAIATITAAAAAPAAHANHHSDAAPSPECAPTRAVPVRRAARHHYNCRALHRDSIEFAHTHLPINTANLSFNNWRARLNRDRTVPSGMPMTTAICCDVISCTVERASGCRNSSGNASMSAVNGRVPVCVDHGALQILVRSDLASESSPRAASADGPQRSARPREPGTRARPRQPSTVPSGTASGRSPAPRPRSPRHFEARRTPREKRSRDCRSTRSAKANVRRRAGCCWFQGDGDLPHMP